MVSWEKIEILAQLEVGVALGAQQELEVVTGLGVMELGIEEEEKQLVQMEIGIIEKVEAVLEAALGWEAEGDLEETLVLEVEAQVKVIQD